MKTENELIAEFMGVRVHHANNVLWIQSETREDMFPYTPESSWNDLMPVVLYAKKLPNSAEWNWEILNMYLCRCEISGVHKELVAFIKWFNSQNS